MSNHVEPDTDTSNDVLVTLCGGKVVGVDGPHLYRRSYVRRLPVDVDNDDVCMGRVLLHGVRSEFWIINK